MSGLTAKAKDIAEGLVLTTTDNTDDHGNVTSILYSLSVKKNKRCVFEIDFSGSGNLELSDGGLIKRTSISPFTDEVVALLQVVDPGKAWSLECKYSWTEEDPDQAVPGEPKRQEISKDIYLITTRSEAPENRFLYEVVCAKYCVVSFLLDCTGSTNMRLQSGGLTKQTIVQPYDRTTVGVLEVGDASKPWSLKSKFSWSESTPAGKGAVGDRSTEKKRAARAASTEKGLAPSVPKREEISPGIFLTSTTVGPPTLITWELEVLKRAVVKFHADFSASANLELQSGGLRKVTIAKPFEKTLVAVLRVINSTEKWKLESKYHWEEHAETSTEIAASGPPPPGMSAPGHLPAKPPTLPAAVTKPPRRDSYNTVWRQGSEGEWLSGSQLDPRAQQTSDDALPNTTRGLLDATGLAQYSSLFEAEALTMEILLSMSEDERTFRESLKELGIGKMGHRELLVKKLRQIRSAA